MTQFTRRTLLKVSATGTIAALGGCLGGGGENSTNSSDGGDSGTQDEGASNGSNSSDESGNNTESAMDYKLRIVNDAETTYRLSVDITPLDESGNETDVVYENSYELPPGEELSLDSAVKTDIAYRITVSMAGENGAEQSWTMDKYASLKIRVTSDGTLTATNTEM